MAAEGMPCKTPGRDSEQSVCTEPTYALAGHMWAAATSGENDRVQQQVGSSEEPGRPEGRVRLTRIWQQYREELIVWQ
ncbi:hypothetical protein E2C01_019063 [Portunus trituberculatus]|uniref:Uncharacterized protein n=1 Tax=Portunus trituberculatus TaxID=210409 RepID=A0A5B7DXV6_PORTR|nr:hypothetical protein [Portunus trituberculatus]